jgi:hypothetical protein
MTRSRGRHGAGTGCAKLRDVMRRDDEEDRKKPLPSIVTKKGTNALESVEDSPWLIRNDNDRHRHLV